MMTLGLAAHVMIAGLQHQGAVTISFQPPAGRTIFYKFSSSLSLDESSHRTISSSKPITLKLHVLSRSGDTTTLEIEEGYARPNRFVVDKNGRVSPRSMTSFALGALPAKPTIVGGEWVAKIDGIGLGSSLAGNEKWSGEIQTRCKLNGFVRYGGSLRANIVCRGSGTLINTDINTAMRVVAKMKGTYLIDVRTGLIESARIEWTGDVYPQEKGRKPKVRLISVLKATAAVAGFSRSQPKPDRPL